jgi:hypothetical protein
MIEQSKIEKRPRGLKSVGDPAQLTGTANKVIRCNATRKE